LTYFFYIFSDTDEYWHSTAIDHVKDKRTLVTTSGSIYKLHGKICKLDTLERGNLAVKSFSVYNIIIPEFV
jgi:hypothetical protein